MPRAFGITSAPTKRTRMKTLRVNGFKRQQIRLSSSSVFSSKPPSAALPNFFTCLTFHEYSYPEKFFPVVIESNDESSAHKSTYLQTRFLLRRNDKKEPKLISIAIGRNQDQGPFANKSVKKKVDRLLAQSKNISHFCYYLWNGDI